MAPHRIGEFVVRIAAVVALVVVAAYVVFAPFGSAALNTCLETHSSDTCRAALR